MNIMDPKFEVGGEWGATPVAAQVRAAYAAGLSGDIVAELVLRSTTPVQFHAKLAEAKEIHALAKMALDGDPETRGRGVLNAIRRGISVATAKAEMVTIRAQVDQETHTDTTKPLGVISAATSEIYAHRIAEINATLTGGANG